jgi:activating signal cointegrator complex subunit 3
MRAYWCAGSVSLGLAVWTLQMDELDTLRHNEHVCIYEVPEGDSATECAKTNVLLQSYISSARIEAFTLISDQNYIVQSAGRIARALFEIALKRGWTYCAARLLDVCKMIDHRLWDFMHPLRQFPSFKPEWAMRLETKQLTLDRLVEMEPSDIGAMINLNTPIGKDIKRFTDQFPHLGLDVLVQPITRSVLRLSVTLTPQFRWHDSAHGAVEPFWLWVEDAENQHIYHTEYFLLHKNQLDEPHKLEFTVPVFDPPPSQYLIVCHSDRWMGSKNMQTISFKHLILPDSHPPHTNLLNLLPLPIAALHNPEYQQLYKYSHFNPVQTQVFHTLYHTDHNVLLGAPTGSGKTVVAELAIFRLMNQYPGQKAVYVAPLKALARERLADWSNTFGKLLGRRVVELTGDVTPDTVALNQADIIITTPEKWDGITRGWQTRSYVRHVGLVIIDEIHLLGQDRGPVLEVIVSRMRYITAHTESRIRVVGLSTALANAHDLADWLGIEGDGLFNFPPSVRPVPLTVHISGFPGKHYCPRMATMNKPTYAAITTYSPDKPVLVFVASRRQTRLTALDLIGFTANDDNPRKWLHLDGDVLETILPSVHDASLRHCLAFGVGLHHAGLVEEDRKLVENLFVDQKIQVLVCTSTLAWGVNFPAHLVVIKGTEFYDGKTKRYVDFPITDVLQMMGRAGRPQFDTEGRACILVHEPKKTFYRKFLYEPFPVESSLASQLHNHLNAEIVGGTVRSRADALDYLTWTYFFRRLIQNPSYYHLDSNEPSAINDFLLALIDRVFGDLEGAGCLRWVTVSGVRYADVY